MCAVPVNAEYNKMMPTMHFVIQLNLFAAGLAFIAHLSLYFKYEKAKYEV